MASVKIKGLNAVLRNLKKFGEEAEKEVSIIVRETANDTVLSAKSLAPVDNGFLRNQIDSEKVDKLTYKVAANARYSAYQEFGTGGLVEVPAEMREIASNFKGKGIKKINIPPQPFLYPSFVKHSKTYLKDLKDLFKTLAKKYSA